LIKHDDHDVVNAADAADVESFVMMQTSSNSDQKLITSTIQTFKYVSAIEEKI